MNIVLTTGPESSLPYAQNPLTISVCLSMISLIGLADCSCEKLGRELLQGIILAMAVWQISLAKKRLAADHVGVKPVCPMDMGQAREATVLGGR
jgi:hypothetical protein